MQTLMNRASTLFSSSYAKTCALGATVVALALATPAFAAPADVTAVTAAIADAGPPIAAIGAAVLIVLVGVKVYKWIRRAL